jgi:hypothetical protein
MQLEGTGVVFRLILVGYILSGQSREPLSRAMKAGSLQ